MKTIRYILLFAVLPALLSLLTACTRDDLGAGDPAAEGKLTLRIGLTLPEAQSVQTRLLDDVPFQPDAGYMDKLNLYIFIFEDTGSRESNFLRTLIHGDQIKAEPATTDPDHSVGGADKPYKIYSTTVDGTSEKAIIHLVATSDPTFEEQLANITDRSELGIFSGANGVYTKGQHAAYWKKIKLGMPINEENLSEINAKLTHVKLIRNFARMKVQTTTDPARQAGLNGFVLDGFELVNAVDCGYVAAYSESVDPATGTKRGFVDFEDADTGAALAYGDIVAGDYQYTGTRHPLSQRVNRDDQTDWVANAAFNSDPKYMFERPYQEDHKTYVLVKGHFDDDLSTTRYIKLDIGTTPEWHIDEETGNPYGVFETYHLLRNMSFDMTINSVDDRDVGHATPEGALAMPPANNLSTAVETSNLLNIYYAPDLMQVNFNTLIIVDDDEGNPNPRFADLKWCYYTNYVDNDNKTRVSDLVKWNFPGYDFSLPDTNGIIASWGDAMNTTTPVQGDEHRFEDTDWWHLKLYFDKPTEAVRQKTIRLYMPPVEETQSDGTSNTRFGLSRDITFVMRKRWEFVNNSPDKYPSNIEVYPGVYSYADGTMPAETLDEMRELVPPGYVGSQRGAQLTVMFELPGDLPRALFPLQFTIEADRQNIENAYAGNATVTTGRSLFDNDGVNVSRIQFVKTVDWAYYHGTGDAGDNGHKIVTARFITTNDVLDESGFVGTVAETRVRVYNRYFKIGEDSFERAAHDDVVDPTRTHWYWNFSYSEWATYFAEYYNKADVVDPLTLNNLHFVSYTQSSTSFGNYMCIGQNADDPVEADATKDRPEYSFPVAFSTSDYGGTLTVKAQVDRGRDNRTGSLIGGYGFDLYDRDVHAAVVTADNRIIDLTCTSDGNRLYHRCTQTSSGNNPGSPRDPADCVFSLQNVPTDTQITEIRVWAVRTQEYSTANYDYRLKGGKTRYYSIEMTLTPR